MNSIIENDSGQTHPDWVRGEDWPQPRVGLGNSLAVSPRVAEYSNPGLEDGSPSGTCPNSSAPTQLVD